MAKNVRLSPTALKLIDKAVDLLFERAKARLLGPGAHKMYARKQLVLKLNPKDTLTGLYRQASQFEGMDPKENVMKGLLRIAGSYLDATKEKTKAKVQHSVQSFLTDAIAQGIKTDARTVLGGQLAELWGDVKKDVRRIVETETTVVRNTSIYDAIGRMSALDGVEDPTVFFVTVRDDVRCDECTRLHLLPDGTTPRVWKQSELGSGYHKKGDPNPKIAGLHPHCRCVLTVLMRGYGFDSGGMVTYKEPDWDEYKHQRE